ncbi:hypothetical protein [Sulfurovum sp. NBC37-1]|uniref:hypothetical protein n=1 Tax=Sulfurovum sp. (strain NBC37-1) TaxID=387093 RepID=UPI00015874D4|nr:hypothetical protein [Sulfurovum sp. NBC37-1]BAF71780.1 hypothetical protein SUN_0822 [Sulfurovum sp. NBC37-1]
MKLLKPLLIGTSGLLFTGCCTCFPQPSYDKNIVFVQGKPYLVPHGAEFSNVPVKNDVTVKDYRQAREDCKKGYITWTSPKAAIELKETYRTKGADAFSYAYQNAIRDHKMGCSKPLSNSEYEYYKTQYGQ